MAEGQIELWRKKENHNVEVEAVRLTEDNAEQMAAWCKGTIIEEIDPEHPEEMQPGINFQTPQGMRRASLHDYLIRFGNQFFTTSNRRFEEVYEPVNRPATPLGSAGDTRKRLGFADPFAPPGGSF